ncbi:MAG TPA: hypothetical protein VGQ83_01175 [Polyangia bacterium]|jgi:hypothetical protein
MPHWRVSLFACALTAALGCGVDDISAHVNRDSGTEELCAPTGRSLIDTGVYIGPDGCAAVTLYALQDANPTAWVLAVAWPMYGEYHALEIKNLTTSDTETEILYLGDPEFTLFAGDYNLGGFEVASGDNVMEYKVYNTVATDGGYVENIVAQGQFTLRVQLSDSTGG